MSTKPVITEGHISSRHDATSGRVMRVALICAFLAGAALLALALIAAIGRGAVASPDATPIDHVCANKSSGQLFYLTSCKKSQTSVPVTSTSTQFKVCYLASNGVTRKVSDSTTCGSSPRRNENTIPKVPADSDSLYFCVKSSDGTMFFKGTSEPTCAAGQFAVVIGPHNQPPAATNDAYSVNEDETLNVSAPGVLANDSDPDNDPITAQLDTGPSHADSFTLNADGSFSYKPEANFNGSDSFKYKAKDSQNGLSAAVTVTITVTPVNDTPDAVDDGSEASPAATTDEDVATGQIDVLANDTGLGDTPISVTIETQGSKGTATVNANNTITYTPDADANGPDSFTYKVCDADSTPECDTATVHVAITAVNDTPDAIDDGSASTPAATVNEDSTTGATVNVLANDTGLGDTPITVSIQTQGSKGTATVNPNNSVTYVPAPDENGPDSFVYEVCDGDSTPECDTATVSIAIEAVNDAPVNTVPAGPLTAVQDTDTPISGISIADVDAGSGAVKVTLSVTGGTLTLKTDVSGGLGANDVSANGTGSVIATGTLAQINATLDDANGLVYHSDATFTGTDTLTVTTDDQGNTGSGGPKTDTDTVTINVEPPDEPPVAVDDSATKAEDSGATAIDVLANDTDVDGGPKTIDSVTQPTNGTVAITGGGSGLTYAPNANYCNDPPGTNPDTFTYTLSPGGSTATVSVTVTCVDDSPLAVNDSATVNEDAAATAIDVLANDTDIDGGPKTISSASDPANGTVVLTGGSPGAHTSLTYQPDANYCNDPPGTTSDTFTYTLNGGSTATVSMTVTCVNDAPVLANIEGGALSYTENDAPKAITSSLTVADVDNANLTGAKVTITAGYQNGQDVLAFTDQNNISGSWNATTGTLTLSGSSSVVNYQTALRSVTYENTSNDPSTAARTVSFTVDDGEAQNHESNSQSRNISVISVDDPPVAFNDSATVLEDAAATAIDVLANDTDVDGGPKTITEVTQPTNGTVVITGGGTGLTYAPNANYCNDPGDAPDDTFTYKLNGGSQGTVSMTVTCVNDNPVADDETFNGASSAVGNTTLVGNDPDDAAPATPDPTDTAPVTDRPHKTITGDILAGDTDVDGPGPLTVTAGTFATNDGGTVTIQSDGDFTFEPAASTSCTDTSDFFDYTINDNGSPNQTDTGRVTIAITGCVWYVNNDDAQGNSGTSEKPFDTLAQAETASAAGHSIFVYDGNDTTTGYSAGINLKANQKLIGEAAALIVGSDTLHSADAANKPTITDNNADVVDLDDGNEVRGFNIDPQGTGGGIAGSSGDTGGGTIDDVNIVDTVSAGTQTAGTQPGLELDSTTGTFNISNLVVNNKATGVRLHNTTTPANAVNAVFAPASQISITSDGGPGLDVDGTAAAPVSLGTSTFDDITVTNSGSGGANITNATGTTTFGDGTGTDLALTTTSGSTPAFSLTNATGQTGTVAVPSSGTANVSATGGPAVDISATNTNATGFNFDDVDSTSSANDGINLDGLGTGTFSATSGDIGGAAVIAFDLNGGSGTITYPGNLNNGSGSTADITGRSGGAVTLSGNIADTNDAGGGITMSSNTGGTTTFSGTSKVLNTGTSTAFSSTGSAHTINFTNGGLDIDATSGSGFSATGGGTVTVQTGTNANTIDTTTGTALNVANTNIGASGLTFRSISANGAPNGIVLNNTGASGSLTITGSGNTTQGGDNSGGTIQSTTGHGISLTNTTSPSFTNVRLLNTGNSGVNGTQVSGFSFTNGTITGAGDASDENSITFDDSLTATPNLTGVVTITNNVISQTEAEGVDIENWAGTISNANISSNALSDTGDVATPGSAITLIGSGLINSAANITKATVANNTIVDFRAGVGVQVRAGNPNAGGPTGSAGTAGNATNVIDVTGNSMNGGNAGIGNQPDRFFTGGVSGNGGQGNFNVSNNGTAANRIQHIDCIAIEMQMDGPVTMTSTVQNNFINANSAVGCAGIAVGTDDPSDLGAGTHTTTISGNNVMGTDGPGIFPIVRDSGSTMIAKVLNNTVAAPITTNAARAGIRVDSGSAQGDTTMCLEISGNTTAGSTNSGTATTSPGINLRKQGPDPLTNTFGIEGLSPSPTGTPNVENWVNSQNTSTSGTFGVGGTALLSATQGFTSCTAP